MFDCDVIPLMLKIEYQIAIWIDFFDDGEPCCR